MIGFSVANIDHSPPQLELPFGTSADPLALDAAVDRVRRRYGSAALTRAVLLHE